jgi:hypothetical protein
MRKEFDVRFDVQRAAQEASIATVDEWLLARRGGADAQ